ncbi:5'/3'-nucleotidase SurE [Sporobolomyces salmoneus]|uniref:5'/3'-nucleotidase SurE n=1 Tax=Sporobolomyces salmoneus TaxID=183962 RepID=UPI00316FC512
MSTPRQVRVLLTNDDGPPTPENGHSPFIYPFARALVEKLGWQVKVVVPSKQRSWAGKSYVIVEETKGKYYYADHKLSSDGTQGETRDLPLESYNDAANEDKMEMILLDGTPATCSSIALHNLYAPNSFDFVISGPNFGRNTSSAFALSSGTLGAALAGSLSGTPGIALSFGLMEGYKPPGKELVDRAVELSCMVIERLFKLGWGKGENKVDVYSVNVPLMPTILENPKVHWTSMAVTGYGRLFKSLNSSAPLPVDDSGPAAIPEPRGDSKNGKSNGSGEGDENLLVKPEHYSQPLSFGFSPDITHLINPDAGNMKTGEDRTTLHEGGISVTPVRAAFAEAKPPSGIEVENGYIWKL